MIYITVLVGPPTVKKFNPPANFSQFKHWLEVGPRLCWERRGRRKASPLPQFTFLATPLARCS